MASTSSEGGGLKAEGGGGLVGSGDGTVAEAVGVEKTMCNVGEEKGQQSSSSGSLVTLRASGALMKKARRERAGSTAKERISKMPPCTAGKRSSIYRGVTRHRWTGRYEAHLWDKTTWNQNQNKKGKQVYLGAYDDEEAAARAYDLAALKYWGPGTLINFPVTDYSRDLEEMQNVSREEYLASLRRKSSGFSRGISKFRSLSSSRWEPSLGRAAGPEYFQGMQYGDDATPESGFASRFCIERKIDLTGYIKWWAPKKGRSLDSKPSEVSKLGIAEDISRELKLLERSVMSTHPYQMPHLGTSHEGKKKKGPDVSALSILSKSPTYKNIRERLSKIKDIHENDENENKSNVNKIDYGKAVEKSSDHDGEHDRLGVPFGMGGSLLHKSMFPLSPLLSAPLLTSYSAIDPLPDPVLWSSLVSGVPSGPPLTAEVTKAEASSTYGFFRQQDET